MAPQEVTIQKHSELANQGRLDVALSLAATEHSDTLVQNLSRYLIPTQIGLHLLYVVPTPQAHDRRFESLDEEVSAELQQIVHKQFDAYEAVLAKQFLPVIDQTYIQEAESVEEGVLSFVGNHQPDLLVLGQHVESQKHQGWRISSTAYSIATHAKSSILVVKQPPRSAERLRVFFATDGSLHADKAAKDLVRFLPKENTEIIIFSAVTVNYYVLPLVEPYVDYSALERAMTGEAVNLMERYRKLFEHEGYMVSESYVLLGDPVDRILEESEKQQADLVVVGSHGTGGRISRWLLGSVSSKVLEYSPISVAVLK